MYRQDFTIVKKKYDAIGKGAVRVSQSTLILIKDINPNTTNYVFDILESQNQGVKPEEIRLNLNDEFVCTEIGYYLGGLIISEKSGPAQYYFTSPPLELATDYVGLQNAYNGNLRVAVNNVVFIERWDLFKHHKKANEQFSPFITPMGSRIAQFDSAKDGMFDCSPMITFSGAKKNELNTFLTSALNTASSDIIVDDGLKLTLKINQVALILRGFLAQNGAKFQ